MQPGGWVNSPLPPLSNDVVITASGPPNTLSGATTDPYPWNAAFTSGELHFRVPLTHSSYLSGPAWRMRKSSIQSVAGQPVAASFATATHHGFVSGPAACAAAVAFAWRSSPLGGTPLV